MGIDFNKFKPGVNTGQKSNHTSNSSAGSTAAANLAGKTLFKNNWATSSGSLFKAGASVSKQSHNKTQITQDKNYVSSGYWNKQADFYNMKQNLYTGYYSGFNGRTSRSDYRNFQNQWDMMQEMYNATNPYANKTWMQKAGDIAAVGTAALGVIDSFVKIFSGNKASTGSGSASGGLTQSSAQIQSQLEKANAEKTELGTQLKNVGDEIKQHSGKAQTLEENYQSAKQARSKADTAVKAKEQEIKTAKANGQDTAALEAELDKLKNKLEQAQKEYEATEQARNDNKKAIKQLTEQQEKLTKQQQAKEKEIEKLEKQLEKRLEKEQKEIERLNQEIYETGEKETASRDKGKTNRANRQDNRQQNLINKRDDLEKSQAFACGNTEIVGGKTFQTARHNGNNIYAIDGKEVTEEEFKEGQYKALGIPDETIAKGKEEIQKYAEEHGITLPPA